VYRGLLRRINLIQHPVGRRGGTGLTVEKTSAIAKNDLTPTCGEGACSRWAAQQT